jgi:hypothetical protein
MGETLARLPPSSDELSITPNQNMRMMFVRRALENLLRSAATPALMCKRPGNVLPALAILAGAIAVTLGALASDFGSFTAVLAFAIAFAILGGVLLAGAAATSGRARWGPAIAGLVFLLGGLLFAKTSGFWFFLVALSFAATATLAAISFRRLTVPTAEGWKRRDEIEGLKLFLSVAEDDRLRVLNPSDFTPAVYEKLLPYAIALGVEMAWSRRFNAALAASQIVYQPDWYEGEHPWSRSNPSAFSSDLGGGLSGAISAAATPPSSRDFSTVGGGGVSSVDSGSGGGGGGGGGSGW